MGLCKTLILLVFSITIGFSVYCYFSCNQNARIPENFYQDAYWLQDAARKDSTEIKKFVINVDEKILLDLNQRLNSTKFVSPLLDSNFNYGFNGDYLKKVVNYWLNEYKWRTIEAQLNKFDHFKTEIEGLQVHFIHVKPKVTSGVKVVPLMLVHGWPGSFYEFVKAAPMLTKSQDGIAFELIIPSIPGYGFSQPAQKPGLGILDVARIFNKLMTRLGHQRYFYHGGDWGSGIGKMMSIMYPERVSGYHTTILFGQLFKPRTVFKFLLSYFIPNMVLERPDFDYQLMFPLGEKFLTLLKESGYAHIQATKPDTLASSVINSPAGLAAYLLEKFSTWTDAKNIDLTDGGLTKKFTLDELLTNVMIYWVTDSFPSSVRLYKEALIGATFGEISRVKFPEAVPVGLAVFPNEIELIKLPRFLAEDAYPNIVHFSYMKSGGHFPALEEPETVANDVRKFVQTCLQLEVNKLLSQKDKKEL